MNKKAKIAYVLSWVFGISSVFTWIFAEWADHFNTIVFGRTAEHFFGDAILGMLFAIWFAIGAFYFKDK